MKLSVCMSAVALVLAGTSGAAQAQSFVEGFNGATLPADWIATNLSTRNSTGLPWDVGVGIVNADDEIVVPPYEGTGFAIVNYTSVGSGTGTISNWLISPLITGISNGDVFSFMTTTTPESEYPDRLEFRMSQGTGSSAGATTTSVGTFTTLLATVNSTLVVGGYPESWTLVSATITGLSAPVDGRVALRYFVTSGGPTGANSNIIGVDEFSYQAVTAVPEPASWALALAGAGLLAGVGRLRRRSS